MHNFKEKFNDQGFFLLDGFLSSNELEVVRRSLANILENKNVIVYKDRQGLLRRVEKFTFEDSALALVNAKILDFIRIELGESFCLFKDKINYKPSGGEGFNCHYDGVFKFKKGKSDKLYKGWYEYSNKFINVLLAVDDFTDSNGALEVSKQHSGDFDLLYSRTKKDGTPDLIPEVVEACNFVPLHVKAGSIAVFKNTCPHRSGPNQSGSSRRSVYWTYTPAHLGELYSRYFSDKDESTNAYKSLAGDI